jgi:hypothetical protein
MALIPDLGELLNQELTRRSPSGPSYADGTRTPVVFTSTLRGLVGTDTAFSKNLLLGLPLGADRGLGLDNVFALDGVFLPEIVMAINPKSVSFDQPKRFSKKDTRNGSVFFHFTNSKGQNNDILTMRFQGSTGNIDLRGDRSGVGASGAGGALRAASEGSASEGSANLDVSATLTGEGNGALQKLIVWHNLYLLSREPLLLADGTENIFKISYISPLLPTTIDFTGFFNEVLSFTETAEKPHSRDYSFSFIVTSTDPDLDTLLDVLTTSLDQTTADAGFVSGPNTEVF